MHEHLPDNFLVWYEPKVKGRYPDFIILGSTFGLLIVEGKDWYANQVIRADNNFFEIKYKRDNTDISEVQV